MPAPVGKRTFEFVFYNRLGKRSQKSHQLFHKYNLPPNHSLRLNIVRWLPPNRDPNLWINRTFKHYDPEFEIVATVEPNPEPDEDKPCEIPKD
ncbi:hypothetical protein JWG45_15940 [Leptospira sp. 201903070]|uniref:Uncharacterized protein n=2 Tax=Leptospira ainlahdjerensis TaxID=2810033 RepID=A0ABS2UE31_9LEPT|nr:hypothetical protein [Leptospira ainlahdjerensis]